MSTSYVTNNELLKVFDVSQIIFNLNFISFHRHSYRSFNVLKGSLNAYHGTHALRERARKIHEGIIIIR